MTRSPNLLSCSSRVDINKSEMANVNKGVWLVATDSKTAIFRMRRSVLLCTVLHCAFECMACVCPHGKNIPAGLRGSAVVGAIFLCTACHWWIKEDYSWGRRTLGLERWRKKKENKREREAPWFGTLPSRNQSRTKGLRSCVCQSKPRIKSHTQKLH